MKPLIKTLILALAGCLVFTVPLRSYGQSAGFSGDRGTQEAVREYRYLTRSGSPPFGASFDYAPDLVRHTLQEDSSSHSSRAKHIIYGTVIGAATGFVAGLLLDHSATSGSGKCTDNCDHIVYSFEIFTAPIGLIVGGIVGALLPVH